jgi:hypothetical protein
LIEQRERTFSAQLTANIQDICKRSHHGSFFIDYKWYICQSLFGSKMTRGISAIKVLSSMANYLELFNQIKIMIKADSKSIFCVS